MRIDFLVFVLRRVWIRLCCHAWNSSEHLFIRDPSTVSIEESQHGFRQPATAVVTLVEVRENSPRLLQGYSPRNETSVEDREAIFSCQSNNSFRSHREDKLQTAVPTVWDKEMPCISLLFALVVCNQRANPSILFKEKQEHLVESNDGLDFSGFHVEVSSIFGALITKVVGR